MGRLRDTSANIASYLDAGGITGERTSAACTRPAAGPYGLPARPSPDWSTAPDHTCEHVRMLILTRRPGESIHLGDTIKITVLSAKGKQIKLGLEVPEDMPVYREELYRKVKEQNKMALPSSDQDILAVASIWRKEKKS